MKIATLLFLGNLGGTEIFVIVWSEEITGIGTWLGKRYP
jgi:hypothetical protein